MVINPHKALKMIPDFIQIIYELVENKVCVSSVQHCSSVYYACYLLVFFLTPNQNSEDNNECMLYYFNSNPTKETISIKLQNRIFCLNSNYNCL